MKPFFEKLVSLPTSGPMFLSFSESGVGNYSEGFVVRFESGGSSWVGNFIRGVGQADFVGEDPSTEDGVIVVAGGQAFVVNAAKKSVLETFGGSINEVLTSPEGDLIFSDGIRFFLRGLGRKWRSRRVSWDGLRHLSVDKGRISGEAYTFVGEQWIPFTVELSSGTVAGGSFDGDEG